LTWATTAVPRAALRRCLGPTHPLRAPNGSTPFQPSCKRPVPGATAQGRAPRRALNAGPAQGCPVSVLRGRRPGSVRVPVGGERFGPWARCTSWV